MGGFLSGIANFFLRTSDMLRRVIYHDVICQHFCLYKAAGSNFKNVHVHILIAGEYEATSNPDHYTGVGHDDSTPGMADPKDAKHNSVSKGKDCGFQPGHGGEALAPIDLKAYSPFSAYVYPAPAEGKCFPGYGRMKCSCGDLCVTFSPSVHDAWERTQ
jgi:hypothetical protein